MIATIKRALWDAGLAASSVVGRRTPGRVDSIACLLLSGIGNLVLFTPVLSALRARWPRARLVLVAGPEAAPVVEGGPLADEVVRFRALGASDGDWAGLARRLAAFRPDMAISAHPSYQAARAMRAAGARVRVGFRYRVDGVGETGYLWTRAARLDFGRHERDNYLDLVRALGVVPSDLVTRCHVSATDRAVAEAFLRDHAPGDGPVVAIHAGSGAQQAFKQWPIERFVAVADALSVEDGARCVFVGGPGEAPVGLGAVAHAEAAGRLSVCETAALLSLARVLVANDSGPMHIACAVGTPVVAIFGPTVLSKVAPLGPATVLRLPLPCSPCHVPHTDQGGCPERPCLTGIASDAVLAAARRYLGRNVPTAEAAP